MITIRDIKANSRDTKVIGRPLQLTVGHTHFENKVI